jgi:hypothetical protein
MKVLDYAEESPGTAARRKCQGSIFANMCRSARLVPERGGNSTERLAPLFMYYALPQRCKRHLPAA